MAPIYKSQKSFEIEVSKHAAEICDQIILEMGAEIHDDLIQKLSVLGLYLDRLDRSVNNPDETGMLLISMRTDFENVVQAIRRISKKLMPPNLEHDSLQSGIEVLCQNMERPGAGNIHFVCSGQDRNISQFKQAHLYRIVQELIHNAFKHSAAWHVWVRMNWETHQLILEVEDDGTGSHKLSEFIERLRKKHNTLRMRSYAIGALITYNQGQHGLLAKVICPL
jgi:signal transduction histidine kinase